MLFDVPAPSVSISIYSGTSVFADTSQRDVGAAKPQAGSGQPSITSVTRHETPGTTSLMNAGRRCGSRSAAPLLVTGDAPDGGQDGLLKWADIISCCR